MPKGLPRFFNAFKTGMMAPTTTTYAVSGITTSSMASTPILMRYLVGGCCFQQVIERAFMTAIPIAFFRGLPSIISSINCKAAFVFNRPESGMARAELGQQTASGIDFNGVKHKPPAPLLSLTPVKNSPNTNRSTVSCSIEFPRVRRISSTVSRRRAPAS
jgi:hypothetical protein